MRTYLEISRELAALAQAGSAYTKDTFDAERFARLRVLAGELMQISAPMPDFEWPTETGYPTPKVDVRAVVFQGEKVLLIKEAASGLWTLPGGWADVNLSPAENAEKECWEESGFEVRALAVTSVIDRQRAGYPVNLHSIYKLFFLCEIIGGEAKTGPESLAVEFFPLADLPPLDPHRARVEDIRQAWEFAKGASRTLFN